MESQVAYRYSVQRSLSRTPLELKGRGPHNHRDRALESGIDDYRRFHHLDMHPPRDENLLPRLHIDCTVDLLGLQLEFDMRCYTPNYRVPDFSLQSPYQLVSNNYSQLAAQRCVAIECRYRPASSQNFFLSTLLPGAEGAGAPAAESGWGSTSSRRPTLLLGYL